MRQDIMLDLETLGTGNHAAVVAIGACAFDPRGAGIGEAVLYERISLETAMRAGKVDASTVLWWLGQSDDARRSTFQGATATLYEALLRLSVYAKGRSSDGRCGDVRVWGNGATFDNVIVRSAYRAVGLEAPWPFRNDRCYRTACALLPEARRPAWEAKGTKHNALDDAVSQALHLQAVFLELGL